MVKIDTLLLQITSKKVWQAQQLQQSTYLYYRFGKQLDATDSHIPAV